MSRNKQFSVSTLVDLLQEQTKQYGSETLYTYIGDDNVASYTLSYKELDHQGMLD